CRNRCAAAPIRRRNLTGLTGERLGTLRLWGCLALLEDDVVVQEKISAESGLLVWRGRRRGGNAGLSGVQAICRPLLRNGCGLGLGLHLSLLGRDVLLQLFELPHLPPEFVIERFAFVRHVITLLGRP